MKGRRCEYDFKTLFPKRFAESKEETFRSTNRLSFPGSLLHKWLSIYAIDALFPLIKIFSNRWAGFIAKTNQSNCISMNFYTQTIQSNRAEAKPRMWGTALWKPIHVERYSQSFTGLIPNRSLCKNTIWSPNLKWTFFISLSQQKIFERVSQSQWTVISANSCTEYETNLTGIQRNDESCKRTGFHLD